MDLLEFSIWDIAKWFVIVGGLVYVVFAVVVVRQVQLMTKTLEVNFEKPVQMLSYLHLLFAVGVLLLAFIVL